MSLYSFFILLLLFKGYQISLFSKIVFYGDLLVIKLQMKNVGQLIEKEVDLVEKQFG